MGGVRTVYVVRRAPERRGGVPGVPVDEVPTVIKTYGEPFGADRAQGL
ncbi:hypothetical protein ACLVWQ_29205 [Streptomyces sp. CWNU-52B]